MKPSRVGKGYAGETIAWVVVETSLGPAMIAATPKGICRLSFEEGADDLARYFAGAELVERGDSLTGVLDKVIAAIEQPGDAADLPLDLRGTPFLPWFLTLFGRPLDWVLIFTAAGIAQMVVGARLHDARFTGFGIVFLAIDLYTRFFEHFWDPQSAGTFFLVAGALAMLLGYAFERQARAPERSS